MHAIHGFATGNGARQLQTIISPELGETCIHVVCYLNAEHKDWPLHRSVNYFFYLHRSFYLFYVSQDGHVLVAAKKMSLSDKRYPTWSQGLAGKYMYFMGGWVLNKGPIFELRISYMCTLRHT